MSPFKPFFRRTPCNQIVNGVRTSGIELLAMLAFCPTVSQKGRFRSGRVKFRQFLLFSWRRTVPASTEMWFSWTPLLVCSETCFRIEAITATRTRSHPSSMTLAGVQSSIKCSWPWLTALKPNFYSAVDRSRSRKPQKVYYTDFAGTPVWVDWFSVFHGEDQKQSLPEGVRQWVQTGDNCGLEIHLWFGPQQESWTRSQWCVHHQVASTTRDYVWWVAATGALHFRT